jgi:Family of unknown function (DUF6011)
MVLTGLFTTPEAALEYLRGGHGTVTLRSQATGTRFTYRVSLARGAEDRYFVSVLSGPENTADYAYLGLWLPREGRFFRTAKSRVKSDDAPSFAAFAWTLRILAKGRLPAQLEIWHEGTCGRCGRALTVPESVASGMGPVCAEKMS